MNAIIHNQMPADIAEALKTPGGIPKIASPIPPRLKDRIGSLAHRLLKLESEIAELRAEDRAKWEDTSTDMDAILHEAEHAAGVLDEKINGAAREEERARDAADWAETEKSLRTFGMSAR